MIQWLNDSIAPYTIAHGQLCDRRWHLSAGDGFFRDVADRGGAHAAAWTGADDRQGVEAGDEEMQHVGAAGFAHERGGGVCAGEGGGGIERAGGVGTAGSSH